MTKRMTMGAWLIGAAALALATPAIAGERAGNGEDVDPNGRSICSYSGLNDEPEGGDEGPGGRTQSFGQSVKIGLQDPTERDRSHPGFSCNANNLDVSDWHPDP